MSPFRFITRLIVERDGLLRYPNLSSSWWTATAPQNAYLVSGVFLLTNFILLCMITCSSSLSILPGLLWGALDSLRNQLFFPDCARLSHLYTQSRVRLSSLWICVTLLPVAFSWTQSLRSWISSSVFCVFFWPLYILLYDLRLYNVSTMLWYKKCRRCCDTRHIGSKKLKGFDEFTDLELVEWRE